MDSNQATVTITVNRLNNLPQAFDDDFEVDEDDSLNVPAPGVLANDTDADGDPLAAVLVSNVSHGSLTLHANGSFDYTPDANFNGADSFTYRANDGFGDGNLATVSLTVHSVNDALVAVGESYTVEQDIVLSVNAGAGLLINDSDVDLDPLTAALVASPSHGVLTLSSDGSFVYTPNAGYTGDDSFSYRPATGWTCRTPSPCPSPWKVVFATVVFSDSFENGQWDGRWTEDSQNDWFTSTQRLTDGNYSAEVDGSVNDAALTSQVIDLAQYGSVELTFSWYIENGFDSGEYVKLDFFNGVDWNEILSLDGNVDQENTWHHELVQLDAQYLHGGFQFRYRAKVSDSREDANLDNVQLLATSMALQGSLMGSGAANEPLEMSAVATLAHWAESLWDVQDGHPLVDYELRIADLPGALLGTTAGNTITLDADAAGIGWFVDASPWESSEFQDGRSAARVRYDLLTVLVHELGHVQQHEHEEHGVMAPVLQPGVRVLPAREDLHRLPLIPPQDGRFDAHNPARLGGAVRRCSVCHGAYRAR